MTSRLHVLHMSKIIEQLKGPVREAVRPLTMGDIHDHWTETGIALHQITIGEILGVAHEPRMDTTTKSTEKELTPTPATPSKHMKEAKPTPRKRTSARIRAEVDAKVLRTLYDNGPMPKAEIRKMMPNFHARGVNRSVDRMRDKGYVKSVGKTNTAKWAITAAGSRKARKAKA